MKKHSVEHMIGLCPTCHALADNGIYKKQFFSSKDEKVTFAPSYGISVFSEAKSKT
jgi:hypothetical protein